MRAAHTSYRARVASTATFLRETVWKASDPRRNRTNPVTYSTSHTLRIAAALAALVAPAFAAAAGSDHAKGTLTVQAEAKPLQMELKHAYYVSGPDTFEAGKMTRRVVFAGDDLAATIRACADVGCATAPPGDGLMLELDDAAPSRYWAHVRPMQYSGSVDSGGLVLKTDTADRLAGTLTIADAGVKTTIEFDATLLKTFAPPK
jgi:hypothetical protein